MSELEIKFKEFLKSEDGKIALNNCRTSAIEALRLVFYAGSMAHEEIAQELADKAKGD